MTNMPPNDDLIFAYLDGELDTQQRAEFEALLDADPKLQWRINGLQSITTSVHRIAREPSPSIPINAAQTPKPKANRIKWIAYAATIAIASTVMILMQPSTPQREVDAQRFYTKTTTNFVPDIVCDTPEKFEAYTKEAFNRTITADFETPVQLVGWKYFTKNYTPEELKDKNTSRALVAQMPDGTPLLAFFPAENFGKLTLKPDSDFHIHTRTISSIRVIEISPYRGPVLLDLLSKK